jgi:hypothetical protein
VSNRHFGRDVYTLVMLTLLLLLCRVVSCRCRVVSLSCRVVVVSLSCRVVVVVIVVGGGSLSEMLKSLDD